jgi:glycosyltransferase involved in cell wall biosynthesis
MVIGGYGESLLNFRGNLLKELVGRNHKVIACAPNASACVRKFLASASVKYYDLPLARVSLNPFKDLITFIVVFKRMLKEKPDSLIAYTHKPIIYTGLALRLLSLLPKNLNKINYVALITGLGSALIPTQTKTHKDVFLASVIKILYRWGLQNAKTVVFQNRDDLKFFKDSALTPANARTVTVAGSGVDLEKFIPIPISRKPVFLMISRLLADKGVREYICAARTVRKKYSGAIFQLAGGLDVNPSAISIDELNGWIKEGVIQYLGQLEDVRPALAGCRYFVLPSYREGLPRSVLEAMAVGRPIVTTDVPGCRETVEHGKNGLKVPAQDPEALAQAMIELLNQKETETVRMSQESALMAKQKFDVEIVNHQLIKILET